MRLVDQNISSLSDLLERLTNDMPSDEPTWFRGQSNSTWLLEPSITRHGGVDNETALVKRFKQNALPNMHARPHSEWDWLFIMQHYGLPTRLMDWTESALVGLYFAVHDFGTDTSDKDGALWALLPVQLNTASNIDTRSENEIPGLGDDEMLDHYLPSKVQQGRHGIRLPPVATIAERNTARMQLQQGVFVILHRDLTPVEHTAGHNAIWRYVIPAGAKDRIKHELQMLNFTELSLFPELPNVANRAKEFIR